MFTFRPFTYLAAFMTLIVVGAGLYYVMVACACSKVIDPSSGRYAADEWPAAYKLVREKFPDVKQLSPEQLDAWLHNSSKPSPVILDARAEKEFAVSHLPDAKHAADEKQALQILAQQAKDAPVVVYCSIGYRSSALAQKLKARGYTNVQNLEGSIFMWANEGRPLLRGGETVSVVHPFDEKWGRLLDRARWSFEAR
jgi:rhodanese-related sulfurtransferase